MEQKPLRTFRTNSQCAKILQYLKDGKSLTVEKARDLRFGSNLRSRISDLERAGYTIKREMIRFSGGYVAQYSLGIDNEAK